MAVESIWYRQWAASLDGMTTPELKDRVELADRRCAELTARYAALSPTRHGLERAVVSRQMDEECWVAKSGAVELDERMRAKRRADVQARGEVRAAERQRSEALDRAVDEARADERALADARAEDLARDRKPSVSVQFARPGLLGFARPLLTRPEPEQKPRLWPWLAGAAALGAGIYTVLGMRGPKKRKSKSKM